MRRLLQAERPERCRPGGLHQQQGAPAARDGTTGSELCRTLLRLPARSFSTVPGWRRHGDRQAAVPWGRGCSRCSGHSRRCGCCPRSRCCPRCCGRRLQPQNQTRHQVSPRTGTRRTGDGEAREQGGGRAEAGRGQGGRSQSDTDRGQERRLDPDLVLDPPWRSRLLQVEQPKQRTIPGSDPTHRPTDPAHGGSGQVQQVLVCGVLAERLAAVRTASAAAAGGQGSYHHSGS